MSTSLASLNPTTVVQPLTPPSSCFLASGKNTHENRLSGTAATTTVSQERDESEPNHEASCKSWGVKLCQSEPGTQRDQHPKPTPITASGPMCRCRTCGATWPHTPSESSSGPMSMCIGCGIMGLHSPSAFSLPLPSDEDPLDNAVSTEIRPVGFVPKNRGISIALPLERGLGDYDYEGDDEEMASRRVENTVKVAKEILAEFEFIDASRAMGMEMEDSATRWDSEAEWVQANTALRWWAYRLLGLELDSSTTPGPGHLLPETEFDEDFSQDLYDYEDDDMHESMSMRLSNSFIDNYEGLDVDVLENAPSTYPTGCCHGVRSF